MNNFSFIVLIATISVHANSTAMNHSNNFNHKACNDGEYGKQIVHTIRIATSTGVIVGGWGFCTTTAQSISPRLPYSMRRAPLALFLASATINQILIASNIDSNPGLLAHIGQISKKTNFNNQ